jgi:hypothetical protein
MTEVLTAHGLAVVCPGGGTWIAYSNGVAVDLGMRMAKGRMT